MSNRVKLENRGKKTLIIKNGKYYCSNSIEDKKQCKSNKTESIPNKKDNVLYCLNVLSPRKQSVNLLNLRQTKYQPKRKYNRTDRNLRRTQSEYISNQKFKTELKKKLSFEAELNSLVNFPSPTTELTEQPNKQANNTSIFNEE